MKTLTHWEKRIGAATGIFSIRRSKNFVNNNG
jgi:hypothetical protein